MNWGPLHSVALTATLSLVGLIALAYYDGATYRDRLPAAYRYLPPHALAHSYSPNLGHSWSAAARHEGLVALALAVREVKYDREDNTLLRLRERCITDDVIRSYGINPEGSVLLAVYFNRIGWFGWNQFEWLFVLPLLDRDTFLRHVSFYLQHSRVPSIEVKITGEERDHAPVEFHIRRSASPDEGTLCDLDRGTVIGSQLKRLDGESVGLIFVPQDAVGHLPLECKAVYASGAEGKCLCATSGSIRTCDKAIDYKIADWPEPPDIANPAAVFADEFPAVTPSDTYIAFPDEGTAVVASSHQLMYLSLEHQEHNALHHFNDADIRRMDRLQSAQHPSQPQILAGALQLPHAIGGGASTFSFRGDEFEVEGDIHLSLDNLDLAILQELFAPRRSTAGPLADFGPNMVDFRLTDANADHYIRFLRTYEPGRVRLDRLAGGFAPLLGLLAEGGFTNLQGHVLDIRRGIPSWLLGVRIGDQDRALRTIRNMQETLRRTRDIDVLTEALLEIDGATPDQWPVLDRLSRMLTPEAPSTWSNYTLADGRVVFRNDGKLPDSLFSGHRLKANDQVYTYYYVSPSITENDLKYRTDQDVSSDVERRRILSDDSRAVAYHDDEGGVVWLASDRETLRLAMGRLIAMEQAAEREAGSAFTASSPSRTEKVVMHLQPTFINAKIFRYPDDLREGIEDLMRPLDGYRIIEILLSPDGSSDALQATIRVAR